MTRVPTDEARAGRQSAWRDVNENIATLAGRLASALSDTDRSWTFMCECGAADCREMLSVTLGAYRAARACDRYLVWPGHEVASDRVVERHDDYLVVAP